MPMHRRRSTRNTRSAKSDKIEEAAIKKLKDILARGADDSYRRAVKEADENNLTGSERDRFLFAYGGIDGCSSVRAFVETGQERGASDSQSLNAAINTYNAYPYIVSQWSPVFSEWRADPDEPIGPKPQWPNAPEPPKSTKVR